MSALRALRSSPGIALLLLAACSTPQAETPAEAPADAATTGVARAEDGLAVAYDVRGRGDVALVFVHCWACDRTFWREQLDAFADRYRVVSLDLGGHGESGRDRNEWTIAGLAGDVAAVVDALGLERVVLVGHSMGGPVSLAAAPLLGERLQAIVCADTLHSVNRPADAQTIAPILERMREDYEGFMAEAVQGMMAETADPGLREWVVSRGLQADRNATVALVADFPRFDLRTALAEARVPIRCINAAPRPPAGAPTDIAGNREVADFDAVLMDGVGHYVMLEQPDEFNRHLAALLTDLLAN